jgi:hypothetical protein
VPVLRHIRRVARATPTEAQAVSWLHEALESGGVTEHQLLAAGLGDDELRALRLLARTTDTRSERVYLAHVELIARAAGESGELARLVKTADLEDRCRHPRVRPDGWSPPYARALRRLRALDDADQLLPMATYLKTARQAAARGQPLDHALAQQPEAHGDVNERSPSDRWTSMCAQLAERSRGDSRTW